MVVDMTAGVIDGSDYSYKPSVNNSLE